MEVLISLFIISVLLLVIENLQRTVNSKMRAASFQIIANKQIDGLIEVLKIQTVATALIPWNKQNQQLLPNGYGTLEGEPSHRIIRVFWGQKRSDNCAATHIAPSGCVRFDYDAV